jgi:hypothetical protein
VVRLSARGVTLVELMFVCGLFALVLTVLAASLRQTAASQKQLDRGSEVLVTMELTRLKIGELLRRSELGAPMPYDTPANQLTVNPFRMEPSGGPQLNARGLPVVGPSATLALEGEGNLVLRGGGTQTLISRLGRDATFQVTRVSESRFLFRLTADDGMKEPREFVFISGF